MSKTIDEYDDIVSVDRSADRLLIWDASDEATYKVAPGTLLGITGDPVGDDDTQTLSNKTIDNTSTINIKDANFTIQDDGDTTKRAKFQASGIGAGQTRVFSLPNYDATLATIAGTETLTNKTLTAPTINAGTIDGATLENSSIDGNDNTVTNIAEGSLLLSDNTTNDVTTSKHGFAPKAPNDTAKFLRGDATWALLAGGVLDNMEIFTYTGVNQTWTKPDGLGKVLVIVIGGGSGGGGVNQPSAGQFSAATSGGGGGGSLKWIDAADLGATETVVVGAGGAGGTAGANSGSAGGTSSFGTHLQATGGTGGGGGSTSSIDLQIAGAAESGGVGSGGDINVAGGGAGWYFHGTGASNARVGSGKAGDSAFGFGMGAAPIRSSGGTAAGNNAPAGYGGGGGGAIGLSNSGGNMAGGSGSAGIVIVYEYK